MYTIIVVSGNWIPTSAIRASRQALHTLAYGVSKTFLLSSLTAPSAWFYRLEFNSVGFHWALDQLAGRDLDSDAVSVGKQFLELSPNIPAAQEIPDEPSGQAVVNAVPEKADAWAFSREKMGVLPLAERDGGLGMAELAALELVAVLENPAHAERAKARTQDAAVAVADPRSVLFDFNVFPWGRQFLERARPGVPAEKIFGGGRCLRAGDKLIFAGHPSPDSPPPSKP